MFPRPHFFCWNKLIVPAYLQPKVFRTLFIQIVPFADIFRLDSQNGSFEV